MGTEPDCPPAVAAAAPRLLLATTVPATLQAFLLPYARHFRGLGWRVDALTGATPVPGERVQEAFDAVHAVRWGRSPFRALLRVPACCRRIRSLVAVNRYDIVHVHTPVAGFVTRLALRSLRAAARTRVVYTAHGFHFHPLGRPLANCVYRCLEAQAGRWTDALVVMNAEDFAAARRCRLVAAARLHRMPGIGLDLAHWRRDDGSDAGSSTFRTRLGIGADAPVLLCVAELVARKRHADLLKGFAALVHGGSFAPDRQPVLVLAGDGPLRDPLAAMAAGLGVADHVRWVGFQDDLRPFYQAAAMTVLVSLQEGLPRCLMESLAMETPVVATDVRGNHEIADTSCGRLVPPRNPLALAAAMRELLALKPEERREMGRRGRARMEKYSLARCLEMTEAVYAKVLECGDPAPLCCARPGTRN